MFNFYTYANIENETRFATDYLTAENKRSITDAVRELNKAVDSGDFQNVLRLARNLVNTENRNRKIDRHETIINAIIEQLTSEMNVGDCITWLETAETIRECRPEWCEKDENGSPALPLGAVACAFNRLIDTEKYVLIHYHGRKYFQRISR